MLRILGDRRSLMAALTAHWLDQQLHLPPAASTPQRSRPASAPSRRKSRSGR